MHVHTHARTPQTCFRTEIACVFWCVMHIFLCIYIEHVCVRTYADTLAPSRRLYLELPVPPGSVRVTPYGRTRVSFTDATSIWSDSESSPPSQHLPDEQQFSFGGQHVHQDTFRARREHLDQAHSLFAARPASPLRANSQLATPSTPQEARGDEHHLALTSLCDSNAGVLPATLPL